MIYMRAFQSTAAELAERGVIGVYPVAVLLNQGQNA